MPGIGSDYQPGFQVNKAYEVIGVIGHGAMGAVYHVRHLFLSKEMALKVLRSTGVSETAWRRFQIEAQAIARLNHPNIVRIFDMGLIDGVTPYYAMELLNGQSLADKLDKKTLLPVPEALAIFRQVCAGLAYAHEHEIVHRDIKPGNIVLQEVEPGVISAKLVDFGIVKLTGDSDGDKQGLTRPGEVCGSPQYMSPEQCSGVNVTYRTDLYSLGVALFETLTGAVPFRGKNAVATMEMHQGQEPLSLFDASEGMDFPPELQEVVSTLLAKDPLDRYQSASDVAAQLLVIERSFVDNEQNVRKPQSASVVRKPYSRRDQDDTEETGTHDNKKTLILVGSALALVLVLSLGAAGYFMFAQNNHVKGDSAKVALEESKAAQTKLGGQLKAEAEITEPYFQGTQNKDGHQVSYYKFPKDFSIGEMEIKSDEGRDAKQAQGDMYVPTRALMHFTPNDKCLRFPQLLRRFDDSSSLQMITLSEFGEDAASAFSGDGLEKPTAKVASGAKQLVTDELLKYISQIKSLYGIELSDTSITGECLVLLSHFPKLTELRISSTAINGEQLAQSNILPQLELLGADGNKKMNVAIAALRDSPKLRQLHVASCALTDQDVHEIGTMKKISRLKLSNNKLKDADLEPLTKLPLQYLYLGGCKLTPACLKYVSAIPTLQHLDITHNGWTAEQFAKFKADLKKVNAEINIPEDLNTVPALEPMQTQLESDK